MAEDLSNDGERMTPDAGNWSYYAHLSIYRFAQPFLAGKRTLEAGCGTGYGSAYLFHNGVRELTACDAGAEAIDFCQSRYADTDVRFHVQDLCARLPYDDGSFEAIFSSNVMEHLADIDHFMEECRRVITSDGTMVIAVPPIVDADALRVNIENVFHITHLTPFGWYSKIGRYFEDVRCFTHDPGGRFADRAVNDAEVHLPADQVTIRETDFVFPELPPEKQNRKGTTTVLYVATKPRQKALSRTPNEQLPYEWFHGAIVARVIDAERNAHRKMVAVLESEAAELTTRIAELNAAYAKLDTAYAELTSANSKLGAAAADLKADRAAEVDERAKVSELQSEIAALRRSTSWRVTEPVRQVVRLFKKG